MKTLFSVYAVDSVDYAFDPVFDGCNAVDRVVSWINTVSHEHKCGDSYEAVFFTCSRHEAGIRASLEKSCIPASVVITEHMTASDYINALAVRVDGIDTVICARYSCPFYDAVLTARLYELHTQTAAEYTFADGWPEGFAPCIINGGTVSVIAALARKQQAVPVSRTVFFDAIKQDINSFEIETLIAPEDMRLYRLDFSCETKEKTCACVNLFRVIRETSGETGCFSADNLAAKAVFESSVLRTVPAFYNIQISAACAGTCICCPYPAAYKERYGHDVSRAGELNPHGFMDSGDFARLMDQAAALSGEAVIAVSLWGEPLLHPRFTECIASVLCHPGLSVLVETDGMLVTRTLIDAVQSVVAAAPARTTDKPPIVWIVSMDAVDEPMYRQMHGSGTESYPLSLNRAEEAVHLLEKAFPAAVYRQFVRTQINEPQLETFYRTYKDSGTVLIQKYDSFAGFLPDYKVTDVSPVVRNPCWHQRRDMVILLDGSVPVCREYMYDGICGNVFTQSMKAVWEQGKYMTFTEKCRLCDEYYTFNF